MVRSKNGVADGTRTHDNQNHNLALYQLNYGHHNKLMRDCMESRVNRQ
jgi:hypothetical protein